MSMTSAVAAGRTYALAGAGLGYGDLHPPHDIRTEVFPAEGHEHRRTVEAMTTRGDARPGRN